VEDLLELLRVHGIKRVVDVRSIPRSCHNPQFNRETLSMRLRSENSNAAGIGGTQNDESALDAGAAYALTRTGATWSQQAYIKASNTGGSDQFG
jgi:Domain of unknown function DUF488